MLHLVYGIHRFKPKLSASLMKIASISLSLVLITAVRAAPSQEPPPYEKWRPELSSPGAQLVVREIERRKAEGVTLLKWQFSATGLPKDKIYRFWIWELARDPQLGLDAKLTQKGELVYPREGHKPEESDPVEINLFAVLAEPKRFALVSADSQFRAFGEVIPFPIEARDGACKMSVVMLAPLYELVSVRAEGLQPNESFQVRMQSGREIGRLKRKADGSGKWSAVVAPYVKGKKEGSTEVELNGAGCNLNTVFPWGLHSYQ